MYICTEQEQEESPIQLFFHKVSAALHQTILEKEATGAASRKSYR